MNPLPLAAAEFRRNPMGCAAVIVLIAIAVALGVALSAQERALRVATLRAADRFDLVVGHEAIVGSDFDFTAVLGNVHDLLRSVTFAFDGLLVTAVLLVIVAVLSARRQSVGALRALGAPPLFVFTAVWLQGALLIAAGVVSGLGLGYILAKAISAFAAVELGFDVDATIGAPELILASSLFIAGSLFGAAPSLPLLRVPATRLLRSN